MTTGITNIYNIVDYGAVSGGTTDCTSAINAAVAAASAAGGGTVFIGTGKWLITTLSTIPDDVTIEGAGQGATIVVSASTTGTVFSIVGNRVTIKYLTLKSTATRTAGAAISISGGVNTVEHLSILIDGVGTHCWYNGIVVNDINGNTGGTYTTTLRNIEIGSPSNIGVWLECNSGGTMDSVTVAGNTAFYANYAFLFNNSNALFVDNTDCGTVKVGVAIEPGPGTVAFALYFNNVFLDNIYYQGTGFLVSPTIGSTYATSGTVYEIRANNLWVSVGGGATTGGKGFHIIGTAIGGEPLVSDLKFVNCMARSNSAGTEGVGFEFDGCHDVSCENSIFSGFYFGMLADSNTSHFSFIGNSCGAYGNPSGTSLANNTGIYVNTGASDHYMISNNRVYGNSTALTDSGTGSNKYVVGNIS